MENDLVKAQKGVQFFYAVAVVFLLEAFGTASLIYAINMTGNNTIGIPLMLYIIIVMTGPISGAHVNPSVTTGVFIIKNNDWRVNIWWVLCYFAAQFSGSMLGVLFASISLKLTNGQEANYPQFKPGSSGLYNASNGSVWFTEFYCTFWFVSIVMHAKEATLVSNFKNTLLVMMTVAAALATCIFVAADHTGACFNPAVAFAQYMMCLFHSDSNECGKYVWIYFTADFCGAICAGLFAIYHAKMTAWLTPMGKVIAKADPEKLLFQSFSGSTKVTPSGTPSQGNLRDIKDEDFNPLAGNGDLAEPMNISELPYTIDGASNDNN